MTRAALAFLAIVTTTAGCHRPKQYSAAADVKRISAVKKEPDGRTAVGEVELEYAKCPGTQIEVVRGDAAFARCLEEHVTVGERVSVAVERHWGNDGHWEHEVLDVGGCHHVRDPSDDGSFKLVRECQDMRTNDTRVGFRCNTLASEELVKACPWFER